jgi:hypothetical protein
MNTPTKAPQVLHLLGGQAVIGFVSINCDPIITVDHPFEIMTTPSEHTQRSQIALLAYGSMLGVMPQLATRQLVLQMSSVVSLPVDAPPDLIEHYMRAAFPSPDEQIKAAQGRHAMAQSNFDITKGGTL